MRHMLAYVLLFWSMSIFAAEDFYSAAEANQTNTYEVAQSIQVQLNQPTKYVYKGDDPFRLPGRGPKRNQIEDEVLYRYRCTIDPGSRIRIQFKGSSELRAEILWSSDQGPTYRPCGERDKIITIQKEEFNLLRKEGKLNFLNR